MKEEWAAAGIGQRILFVLAAGYWMLVTGVALATIALRPQATVPKVARPAGR